MRQTISGLIAAVAVMTAGAAPAMACGGGLFGGNGCCGAAYVEPCVQTYVPAVTYVPVYTGCNTGCGGWGYDRLANPETQYGYGAPAHHQYYYVNQGPTYTGPGAFAPYPTYEEGAGSGWGGYRHHPHYYGHSGYGYRHYGYAPRHHYGYGYGHGYRQHTLRRYY